MAGKTYRQNTSFEDIANDDETSSKGAHGNTRLPFGLCERYGISIGENWTPRDAWDALKGKGITPKKIYDDLSKSQPKKSTVGATQDKPISNVKAFEPAATVEDATKYAEAHFATTVNYGKAKVDGINKVNETLTVLSQQYPIANLRTIQANSRLKVANARANGGLLEIRTSYMNNPTIANWSEYKEKYKSWIETYEQMLANGSYDYSTRVRLRKKADNLKSAIKYDRFSVSSDMPKEKAIEATIAHEYGHILADQYFGQINRAHYCKDYAQTESKRRLAERAYYTAIGNGDIYKISKYAATDKDEFFAECFAAKHMGMQLPGYIDEMLKETLKR